MKINKDQRLFFVDQASRCSHSAINFRHVCKTNEMSTKGLLRPNRGCDAGSGAHKGLLRLNRGCDAWSGGREHRTVVAMQALLQRNRGIVLLKGSAFQPLLNRKHVCDASRRMEASFRYVSEPRKCPTLTWTKNCIF